MGETKRLVLALDKIKKHIRQIRLFMLSSLKTAFKEMRSTVKKTIKVTNKMAIVIMLAIVLALFVVLAFAGGGLITLLGFEYESTKAFFAYFFFLTIVLVIAQFYLTIIGKRLMHLCRTYRQFNIIYTVIECLLFTCLIALLDYDMSTIYIPDIAVATLGVAIVLVKKTFGMKVVYEVRSTEKKDNV